MDSAKLISAVRSRPCLYDSSLPTYHKKVIKSQAWMEISYIVNAPVKKCMRKWRALRDKYNKERKKCMILIASRDPNIIRRNWKFYNSLNWLDKYLKSFNSASKSVMERLNNKTAISEQVHSASNQEFNISQLSIFPPPSSSSTLSNPNSMELKSDSVCNCRSASGQFIKRQFPFKEAACYAKQPHCQTSSNEETDSISTNQLYENLLEKLEAIKQEVNDPDRLFLLSLVPYLRSLPPNKRWPLKFEMMRMVHEEFLNM